MFLTVSNIFPKTFSSSTTILENLNKILFKMSAVSLQNKFWFLAIPDLSMPLQCGKLKNFIKQLSIKNKTLGLYVHVEEMYFNR